MEKKALGLNFTFSKSYCPIMSLAAHVVSLNVSDSVGLLSYLATHKCESFQQLSHLCRMFFSCSVHCTSEV